MAEFLIALAEFDRCRGWAELGFASLFHFLHHELGVSKGAAHYRKTAAELIQTYPQVIDPLRDGRLCLSSITQLAKVITPANREQVLPRFFHRSKRDAMAVVAALQPRAAPHRTVVTKVAPPEEAAVPGADAAAVGAGGAKSGDNRAAVHPGEPPGPEAAAGDRNGASGAVHPVEPPPLASMVANATSGPESSAELFGERRLRRNSTEPLTAELSRLHVTVSKRFLYKLEAARAALSHTHSPGDTEAILEAGLDLVLERHAKRRGMVPKPRNGNILGEASDSSRVPASVMREVWVRDRGRCQWPLESGGICGSTYRVQCDHIVPVALGGQSTKKNLRLLCAFHNDLAARRVFGDAWMDQFTRKHAARMEDRKSPAIPAAEKVRAGSAPEPVNGAQEPAQTKEATATGASAAPAGESEATAGKPEASPEITQRCPSPPTPGASAPETEEKSACPGSAAAGKRRGTPP